MDDFFLHFLVTRIWILLTLLIFWPCFVFQWPTWLTFGWIDMTFGADIREAQRKNLTDLWSSDVSWRPLIRSAFLFVRHFGSDADPKKASAVFCVSCSWTCSPIWWNMVETKVAHSVLGNFTYLFLSVCFLLHLDLITHCCSPYLTVVPQTYLWLFSFSSFPFSFWRLIFSFYHTLFLNLDVLK